MTTNVRAIVAALGIARDAARYADVYGIQAQGSLGNLELYTRLVKGAAAQAREANPPVTVFAGLSTNPGGKKVTPQDLYDAVWANAGRGGGILVAYSGRRCVSSKCGEPEPAVAVELLKMLGQRKD
ncbi:MAG TPA: hypothetical protein VKB88_03665 [Bryobacteraceae bacterium]|nr:hypothetical protein [Bryobacteraceae bacterium]